MVHQLFVVSAEMHLLALFDSSIPLDLVVLDGLGMAALIAVAVVGRGVAFVAVAAVAAAGVAAASAAPAVPSAPADTAAVEELIVVDCTGS